MNWVPVIQGHLCSADNTNEIRLTHKSTLLADYLKSTVVLCCEINTSCGHYHKRCNLFLLTLHPCEWLTWAQGSRPAAEWWHPAQTERQCHSHGGQKPGWKQSSLLPDASFWSIQCLSHSTHTEEGEVSVCSINTYMRKTSNSLVKC